MKCYKCQDTGKVLVSTASAENGPTADPNDEWSTEPCECPRGLEVWRRESAEAEGVIVDILVGASNG